MIENGDLASSLGDIEMTAAKEAFELVPRASDKRGQVWTCIGHLDTAKCAYEAFILSRTPGNVTFTRNALEADANAKRRFVLTLRAVCYKYLGDDGLCADSLDLADKKVESTSYSFEAPATGVYVAVSLFTGLPALTEIIYQRVRGIGNGEAQYGIDAYTFTRLEKILKSTS